MKKQSCEFTKIRSFPNNAAKVKITKQREKGAQVLHIQTKMEKTKKQKQKRKTNKREVFES